MNRRRLTVLIAFAAVVPAGAVALAQPPNDQRQNATRVSRLPAFITGTTVDSTAAESDINGCAAVTGSVWYRIDPGRTRRIVARLHANGDLDATLDVYERLRSDQLPVTCDDSDVHGSAAVAWTARKGKSYLVRVGRQSGSSADTFTLALQGAGGLRLPGPALPAGGVSGSLDRVDRTAQAWSTQMTTGRRYRVSVVHRGPGCVRASVYRAGVKPQPGRPPLGVVGCKGYALFTPRAGQGERFSVLVRASGARGRQRYRLRVAPASRDDSAPGVEIGNYQRVRGALDPGGIDFVDLYRFDVTRRSVLFLHLRSRRGKPDLLLLDPFGNVIHCACDGSGQLHKGLHPGKFFIAARARRTGGEVAPYTLLRASRTITKTFLRPGAQTLAPAQPATLTVTTQPAVDGPVTVTFEQFDPLAGWQFVRAVHTRATAGSATVGFTPPTEGRWRATASYDGTRDAAPSDTGFVKMLVG
jgi:hypothetical protein